MASATLLPSTLSQELQGLYVYDLDNYFLTYGKLFIVEVKYGLFLTKKNKKFIMYIFFVLIVVVIAVTQPFLH